MAGVYAIEVLDKKILHLQTLKWAIKVNEEMMEKYGTKNPSPKVDGKRVAKENDSAQLIIFIKIIRG